MNKRSHQEFLRTEVGNRCGFRPEFRFRDLGRFHQHFTRSFYESKSQKRKKKTDSKTESLALLGSESVKAARKMLVKSTPAPTMSTWS
jgi:hypothetical protein